MDTRTCERCSHLRTEHKGRDTLTRIYAGFRFEVVPTWCHCCDCPQFIPEPDDEISFAAPSTTPEEVA